MDLCEYVCGYGGARIFVFFFSYILWYLCPISTHHEHTSAMHDRYTWVYALQVFRCLLGRSTLHVVVGRRYGQILSKLGDVNFVRHPITKHLISFTIHIHDHIICIHKIFLWIFVFCLFHDKRAKQRITHSTQLGIFAEWVNDFTSRRKNHARHITVFVSITSAAFTYKFYCTHTEHRQLWWVFTVINKNIYNIFLYYFFWLFLFISNIIYTDTHE